MKCLLYDELNDKYMAKKVNENNELRKVHYK